MLKRSCARWELQGGINAGRLRLAEQFATMDGWQRQQDARFDAYVKEKRQKQFFDAFDQRVERAFRVAARAHKTEVVNGFKRKVKSSSDGKWTAAVMLEVKSAVEERLRWLRDVWTQIDADYRCNDAARQAKAAREISDALRGEPGAYMQWVYERKREDRFAGPMEKAAQAAELSAAELPEVSEDEANRYHNLPLRMADIERNVKSRFGIAGQQHWAELQAAKDDAYAEKLDRAAKVYEKLLDQSARYDESRRTALLRSNVERVHQAQVRFQASMAMEKERERLVEAHEAMREERKQQAKADRIAILHEAAELRRSGATSAEVEQLARQRQLEAHARRQAEYQLRERETVQRKRTHYLDMIEHFKEEVERREGQEMLMQQQQQLLPQRGSGGSGSASGLSTPNAFGFMDADRLDGEPTVPSQLATSSGHVASSTTPHESEAGSGFVASQAGFSSATSPRHPQQHQPSRKTELWDVIERDRYEDPFTTVHQARLDAAATYDPVYAKHLPISLAQGKKYSRQGMGEMAAGGEMERHVFKQSARTILPYQWGVSPQVVHDIDGDGSNDYIAGLHWHARHPETGDIDWRYEQKKGGAVFRGPLLYRMGAKREAADPGTSTMDPSTATLRRFAPPPPSTPASRAAARAAVRGALPSSARRAGAPARSAAAAPPSPSTRVASARRGAPRQPALPSWRSS